MTRAEKAEKVLQIVEAFVEKQAVRCPESIWQCDWIIENAYNLMEELIDVSGYYIEPEDRITINETDKPSSNGHYIGLDR